MNRDEYIEAFRAQQPDNALHDDTIGDIGEALTAAEQVFKANQIPLIALYDIGEGFVGPIYFGHEDRYPPEFVIARMATDPELSTSLLVMGFDSIRDKQAETLADRTSWQVDEAVIDEALAAISTLHEAAEHHGVPLFVCAHFARYGEGADSTVSKMVSIAGDARTKMDNLDFWLAIGNADMDEIYKALASRTQVSDLQSAIAQVNESSTVH